MIQDDLKGKRVLVLGFGRQGQALARWLPSRGASVIVNDRRKTLPEDVQKSDFPGVRFVLGRHPVSLIERVDMICVSGGVPLTIPLLQAARQQGVTLTNDAQLFLERCPAPVVGITGSAGKTTTTSLVGSMIDAAGYTTYVGGNIGDVLLDDLDHIQPDDVVVMELSSFQLELMTISPVVAAILNITPNHLDRHGSMEAYTRAKANILKYQRERDMAVLSRDDSVTQSLLGLVRGELSEFSMYTVIPDGAFMMGDRVMLAGSASYDYVPHVLCERSDIPLRGDHNVMNVLAACAIVGSLGLAIDRPGISTEVMCDVIRNFQPVAHRLEVVGEHNQVTYINDSIATAPERLLAALKSFDEKLVLLLGGADKDLPWDKAIHLAMQKARHIIVFGKSGEKQVSDRVMRQLRLRGATSNLISRVETLEEAVQRASEVAQAGDIVLLSPGGTSYDAYRNYVERGDHFRRLVKSL